MHTNHFQGRASLSPARRSVVGSAVSPKPPTPTHSTLNAQLSALILLLALVPAALHAATFPVLQPNQVLWVANPATNGTIVGAVRLVDTNGVQEPLQFRILSGVPNDLAFSLTYSSTNYFGLLTIASKNLLAVSNLFTLQVSATNQDGGNPAGVRLKIIAPSPFSLAELSTNGQSIGRIVAPELAQEVSFGIDPNATLDSRALDALTVLPDGEIRVKNALLLDYEIQTDLALALVMTNRLNSSPLVREIPGQITVLLADINEPPIFAEQALTLPESKTNTFIGTFKADDPEHDPLTFEILEVASGGGAISNEFFTVVNGTNLHLKSLAVSPPASSALTVLVKEIRTDGRAALTNVATVTVEAPKSYSRFGIPLLVPVAGHDAGATRGLPIQAVTTGTNQDIYVTGVDDSKRAYLQIWPSGFYGDPRPIVRLETNFIPTTIAVSGTNIFLAGTKTDSNQAAIYRYSTVGASLRTNYLASSPNTCFNVMDLQAETNALYICGGAGATSSAMKPYWAKLNPDTLDFIDLRLLTYNTGDIPATQLGISASDVDSVNWGVATAITRGDTDTDIFLAGYWNFTWKAYYYPNWWWWLWNWKVWNYYPGQCAFLANANHAASPSQHVKTATKATASTAIEGTVITDLKIVSDGSTPIFAVEQTATKGYRKVALKKYDTGLHLVGGQLSILATNGDVRAESLTVAKEIGKDADTFAVYVTGVIPGRLQTWFDTGTLSTPLYPGGDRFFVAKLDMDLKLVQGWSTPLLLSRFNYSPAGGFPAQPLGETLTFASPPLGPRAPLSLVIPYPTKGGVILAGNIASGTLTLSQSGNENSLTPNPNENAGFITIVKTNKTFEIPLFLDVVSAYGISEKHVRPLNGRQMAVEGETYTAQVLSPLYVRADGSYIGDFDHPPTEQEIKTNAVTRYVCTGYTVADGGPSGDSSSYTFTFTRHTKITFHWTVEHALDISSDLTGTGARLVGEGFERDNVKNLGLTSLAAGNPSPEVKKHWVKQDELVIPSIDGSALDLAEYGTRYVVTGYVATLNYLQQPASQLVAFAAVEPRQQIPQFPMRGPARITWLWGIQHRVQTSTTTLDSQDLPGIKVVAPLSQPDRSGSGEFWFWRGTHLMVGARDVQNSLQGALLATGDLVGKNLDKYFLELFETNFFDIGRGDVTNRYVGAHIDSLTRGTTVSWEYGSQRYAWTTVIGEQVQVVLAAGVSNVVKINTNKPPVLQVLDSPPGSSPADMAVWDQVARLEYPLRPGRFLLHYEGRTDTNTALTLDLTSKLPLAAHYRNLAHPQMPPVNLDPDSADNLTFLRLAFTTNAIVNGTSFSVTNRDTAVLLFTQSDSNTVPFAPASGNTNTEPLLVRVVSTVPYQDPAGPPLPAWIGSRILSTNDTANLGTGFIVYTNARYNAAIYDRSKIASAGPIIPVNRQFRTNDLTHDLVVVWFERRNAILWPYTAEWFDPQWPIALDPAALPETLPDAETMAVNRSHYLRRIVVASRLGSEGKDHALRNQLSFASPRYDEVAIYNQPDPDLPGYNPNEEHALVAPSFKFLDQANPPPAAYALRNNLNSTNHDLSYTSDPFVLVQYLDRGPSAASSPEYKMAVYAVELEDDRPQLNPDRYIYSTPAPGRTNDYAYVFHYNMKAGEPVQPPYPLGLVIGLTSCNQTRGINITDQRVYWEDHRGQPWAVSDGDFRSFFHYPLPEEFWVPDSAVIPPGTCVEFQTGHKTILTGTTPNPRFQPGSQFSLNGQTLTLRGNYADSFLLAITDQPLLASQVAAVILNTGEIQLRALGTNQLTLDSLGFSALAKAGLAEGTIGPTDGVLYSASWPDNLPILKAGETLTFAGGEFKADYPDSKGLPGVVGWASGEVIFDSLNPLMNNKLAFSLYTARLIQPLEERSVQLNHDDASALVQIIQPSTGLTRVKGNRWQFSDLSASLSRRVSYEPLNRRLVLKGFLNDKTLGDSTLTAAPPPLYVLEPNILTPEEAATLSELVDLPAWRTAVSNLYVLSRNPNQLRINPASNADAAAFYAGLEQAVKQVNGQDYLDPNGATVPVPAAARPLKALGPGLALVPSPAVLDPNSHFTSGYVTIVENNHPDLGGPITLYIVKVDHQYRYRGAIKTILSDNVFDEKLTLRHSGDFGANTEDLVYQWFYREEDGTEADLPPGGPWHLFPDQSDNPLRGLGMHQINLEGTGGLLLADNLFFVRYRHRNDSPASGPNATDWSGTQWDLYGRFQTNAGLIAKVGSQWAGAANSPSTDGQYKPQLVMGWIKRVLDRVNPFEARISDFRNETAPATYANMIQEFGQRYEGPVALNPDKNVIENVGLIELYETVLNRGMDLSINLSSPISTPGINTALQLAATRLSDFYVLLGNEAYADAVDPTIAYGDDQMDFATDYGNFASSMFSFQNQLSSLLEEELALLRGVPESYGRPVYNRLFWNFTKSFGEVAYTVNYNITDYNRDGFVNESDAMSLYPQGHGDAWGHYLTALKSHYRLLRHPYYNWVSRAEQYNLLDVVIDVDYLDERRFAEAAAARAKTGAEILNLTYRNHYVEDPDGQWQGYADLDSARAWGVDGWARRAGQAALFDWITANAIIPAEDTNLQHNALQKIDRTTVRAIQTLAAELGEIQSQYDNANNGLNPLGLSTDVVPFDLDATFNAIGSVAQVGRSAVQAMGHFSQIYERAVGAVANARTVFDTANFMQGRQRQVKESADSFRQDVIERDLDFRNRLIEIFGTPYEGQIGTGKAYPAGYYGPDLMLYMYVDVNDVNSATVPGSFTNMTTWVQGFQTQVKRHSYPDGTTTGDFEDDISQWFSGDLATVTNVNVNSLDLEGNKFLVISNLPITASGYTFQAPTEWGRRASPGELQLTICELVQAEAELAKSAADYSVQVRKIQDIADLIEARHGVAARDLWIRQEQEKAFVSFNGVKMLLRTISGVIDASTKVAADGFEASVEAVPKATPTFGLANSLGDVLGPVRLTLGASKAVTKSAGAISLIGMDKAIQILDDTRGIIEIVDARKMEEANQSYELRQKLKELAQALREELPLRVEAFKRLEALRQVSDRYRRTLESGRRLLDERQVFNIRSAGVAQRLRYQDMAFRVFRSDALQKYHAAYDLAARYTYMAAKAFDYETNLSPDDRASAQPLMTQIVRSRLLGGMQNGEPMVGGTGLAGVLAVLRDNWGVLCGRMSFNNAQYEQELVSLRRELFRIPDDSAHDPLWRQTLKQYCVADLWEVPEFRRYCRPPAPRRAGPMPGLVLPFATEIVFGRNVFGWPVGPGDHAYDPSVFATKIQSAAVYFTNYQTVNLSMTPRVYLVPAGLDVMTIPTSPDLQTREWTVVDQAIPVPFQTGTNDLADPYWIATYDSLSESFGQVRRFSSFLAKDITQFDPGADALSYDTRLIGRSIWNTRWLLIIPGGHLLADGQNGLDTLIDGAPVPGSPDPGSRDLNGIKDIQLLFHTYGYSGN